MIYFVSDGLNYGIIDGKLNSDVIAIGFCTGTQFGAYKCEGQQTYIKWNLNLGKSDFEITSVFKVDRVAATALTFVLWSENTQFHIGLDGIGNTLFYQGGTWEGPNPMGQTNLKPNEFQTIVIKRTGSQLKVALDGKDWNVIPISAAIDAVGWRPWKNTIHISLVGTYYSTEMYVLERYELTECT